MKVLNAYGFSTATLRREHDSVLRYMYINYLVVHLVLFSLNPSQILCNGEKLRMSAFSYTFFMVSCITTCVGFRLLFLWVCRKCMTGSQTQPFTVTSCDPSAPKNLTPHTQRCPIPFSYFVSK